jgi:hypothetical protein
MPDSQWNCIFDPGRNIQFVLNGTGSHGAGKSGFRARLKRVHLLVSARKAKVTDVNATVLAEPTQGLHFMYGINTCILNRELLGKRARGVR